MQEARAIRRRWLSPGTFVRVAIAASLVLHSCFWANCRPFNSQRRHFRLAFSRPAAVPDSIKRVGTVEAFPNEYPGQVYAFNWCLNGDGVTPLRKSAFRITKPLDLKIAGLELPKTKPLKVRTKCLLMQISPT
jgi:hypothetical protein